MKDALTVSFVHDGDSEDARRRLEALANGVVDLNLVELDEYPDFKGLEAHSIRYESPRMGKYGQRIGSLSEVLTRRKATCIEAAAIEAALLIQDEEINARVAVIHEMYNGKPRPFRYHAVVEDEEGNVYDSSQNLVGYSQTGGQWWDDHGHCCQNCALGKECAGAAGGCNCGGDH